MPDPWQVITDGTYNRTQRLAVPGGWLYKTTSVEGLAMVFVPDVAMAPYPSTPAYQLPATPDFYRRATV